MPTIPKVERQVQVQAVGTPQRSFASEGVFASGVPGVLANATRAIDAQAAAEQKAAAEQYDLQNEAKTRELDNEFRDALSNTLYDKDNGYYNKRGQDAFTARPLLIQQHEELRKEFLKRAENPDQVAMFDKVSRARTSRHVESSNAYAQKEYQAWQDSSKAASVKKDVDDAVLNYTDVEFVGMMRQSGERNIRELGVSQGKQPEQINAEIAEFNSDINVGIVERVIPEDVTKARAMFDEYVADGGIVGRKQTALARKLKVAEKGDLATDREDYTAITNIAMNKNRVGEFINLDLSTYNLSDRDFKKFTNDQKVAQNSVNKHNEKYSDIRRAMTVSAKVIASAGLKVTGKSSSVKKKQVAAFQSALLDNMEKFESDNGRAPDDKEIIGISSNLLSNAYVPGSGYIFDDEVYLFEDETARIDFDDIEDDVKAKITDAYRRKLNRAPTEEEIEKTYTRSLRNVKLGTK